MNLTSIAITIAVVLTILGAGGLIVGLLLERKHFWRPSLVVLVLAACFAFLTPPSEKLNLGLDLAGGTSLLYEVDTTDLPDAQNEIRRMITTLQNRVDPQGVRNLIWRVESGNRIEIQMPKPNPEVDELRAAFDEAMEELAESNVTRAEVTAAFQLPPGRRQQRLASLARGVEGRAEALADAADAYDRLQLARERYEQVKDDEERAIDVAGEVAAAERDFDQAMQAVEATIIDPVELGTILELSTDNRIDPETGQPTEGTSPRAKALARLKDEHPARVSKVNELVELWDAYAAKKGPLDDPNDLIRLLRGAGVLEFRIAVQTAEEIGGRRGEPDSVPSSQIAELRKQLEERGPRAPTDAPMKWFRIDDPSQWADRAELAEAMSADPAAYFRQNRGMIASQYGSDIYVLLWDTPEKGLTDEQPGWQLTNAYPTSDEKMLPAVGFEFNEIGAKLFGQLTRTHQGRGMAILLDGKVYSAPNINTPITGGRGIIQGGRSGFSQTELQYLIRTLNAGPLKARLSDEPIGIRRVGPSLGADNLLRGLEAAFGALIAVGIFMLCYFFFAGLLADLALLANIIIILGVMSLFDATFTLPGIAGVVLTIGMCVDANVLVFERIREELGRGAELAAAIRLGYQKALSAIVDGNITNLIVCVILYYTASAEVKGFAVTLAVGIGATLFTALFMVRMIFELWVRFGNARKLSMLPTVWTGLRNVLSPNMNWVGLRPVLMSLSGVAIIISLVMVFQRGNQLLDIEFRAGTEVAFDLAEGESMPLEQARGRVQRVADWFSEGFDASQLEGPAAEDYARIQAAIEESRARLIEEDLERIRLLTDGDVPESRVEQLRREARAATDLTQLATTQVVQIGQATADFEASAFSVVTTVTDSPTVAAVITSVFSDVLDVQPSVNFAGDTDDNVSNAPVYPITSATLGEVINRPEVVSNVPNYVGGVAVVLEDMTPPATVADIQQRIKAMRLQPDYENLQFRPFDVIGVTPSADEPNEYRSVVVIVRDPNIDYFNDQSTWESELAGVEWRLIREAMQRETSLAKVSNFTPTVAQTMRDQAIVAIALSFVAIVAYIWFRFGSIRYGLAAIAALGHDVVIALGCVAAAGLIYDAVGANLLQIEPFKINMGLIAALMTIIGYSLNDTIVVFDRIRENRGKLAMVNPAVVNSGINQTISRSLLTSLTTFVAVGFMYIFGGEGIRGFAFALVIGVVVGTYSSIAISAPLLLVGIGREGKETAPAPTAA